MIVEMTLLAPFAFIIFFLGGSTVVVVEEEEVWLFVDILFQEEGGTIMGEAEEGGGGAKNRLGADDGGGANKDGVADDTAVLDTDGTVVLAVNTGALGKSPKSAAKVCDVVSDVVAVVGVEKSNKSATGGRGAEAGALAMGRRAGSFLACTVASCDSSVVVPSFSP